MIVKVFNSTVFDSKVFNLAKHKSCECKFGLYESVSNSKQMSVWV